MKNNINKIIEDNLCTGCGTCISLCQKDAIQLCINKHKGIYLPQIKHSKCINCGVCYESCPGHEVDFKILNYEIFGQQPEDRLIGNFKKCYIGHTKNKDIRYESSSGGLITQILISALNDGTINGALVTRMKKNRPLEPEPFIARTKEEIIEASRSKYCPVPANIALKEILNSEKGEKFAVVGLPCHIHGIRKAEQINKNLKNKIIIHIGIFCGLVPNFNATSYLLRNLKIKQDSIENLSYRGKGWPGNLIIKRKNSENFIPYPKYWECFISFFYPIRCSLCNDWTSELSDLSFGDAWLPNITKNDRVGCSIMISKTVSSMKFLNSNKVKNDIITSLIEQNAIHNSQKGSFWKKEDIQARFKILKILNSKKLPTYNSSFKMGNPSFNAFINGFILYTKSIIGFRQDTWFLIDFYNTLMKTGSYLKSIIQNFSAR